MAILFRRGDDSEKALGSNLVPLVITLLVLICVGLLLVGVLFFLRKRKDKKNESVTTSKNGRQLTINTSLNRRYSEKQGLIDNCSPVCMTPDSIPEIRITFPEEKDALGRTKSGRVVIVEVGEAGVGFVRPVPEDNLPPYQQHDGFSAVDIEKIGGLKEKNRSQWL